MAQILVPLANFAIQRGISAQEFQKMWRIAVVSESARSQRNANLRVNVARISASTGIPRAEISRILRNEDTTKWSQEAAKPHSINRVVNEWSSNPSFVTKRGRPRELKIFGTGTTFEALVQSTGGGLPVRAVLDELVRLGSVELIGVRKVRLILAVTGNRGYSTREMFHLTEHATNILEGIFRKITNIRTELLVSGIEGEVHGETNLPLFRKQALSGGENLLSDLRENLFASTKKNVAEDIETASRRVRIAVIYQEIPTVTGGETFAKKRRNLRRAAQ